MTHVPAEAVREFAQRGLFPTREQHLVLTAALMDRERALDAYAQWRRGLNVAAEFDYEIFRLVPLLYENLRRLGVDDDLTGRLRGAYRMSWAKHHKLAQDTRPIVEEMLGAGLRVMAVKGAPLGALYYGNPALRPMSDFDLVVSPRDAASAIDIVTRRGYVPWRPVNADTLKYRHAMGFKRADGHEFDLHWHVLFDFCDDGADRWFWNGARPFETLGQTLWAPNPTRMLLHTVIHGVRWNVEPPIRWIPDALQILRRAGAEIDWRALVGFAEQRSVCRRLWLGLSYMRREFDAEIPQDVLNRLEHRPLTLLERIENRIILRSHDEVYAGPMGPVLTEFAPFTRYAHDKGPIAFLIEFTHYLRYAWQLPRRRDLFGYLLRRSNKRFRRLVHAT